MLYKINTDIFPPDYYGAKSLNASMRKFADSLIEAGLLTEATAAPEWVKIEEGGQAPTVFADGIAEIEIYLMHPSRINPTRPNEIIAAKFDYEYGKFYCGENDFSYAHYARTLKELNIKAFWRYATPSPTELPHAGE